MGQWHDVVADQLLMLVRKVEDLERRVANVNRPARVTEVDASKGLVKVAYAKDDKGQDVITGWIPWSTRAGRIKIWAPPSVGEQVFLMSTSGDIGPHSYVNLGGYSNQNPQNHDQDGEYKISIGGTNGQGGTHFTLTETKAKIVADQIEDKGGRIDHNKRKGAEIA